MRDIESVKRDFLTAAEAQRMVTDGMAEFQAACSLGDWDRTECARAKVHDAMDSFFDSYAAGHKVLERA